MPGIASTATKLAPNIAKRGFQALSSALECLSENVKTNGTAASAGGFTSTVFSTLKNIFSSPDKPKETTFGNILGRYLNWQEHEKKYGNIYNPRYENMKETLKQDINRELSNSNISNKNRASYESMLRKLGD